MPRFPVSGLAETALPALARSAPSDALDNRKHPYPPARLGCVFVCSALEASLTPSV